MGRLCFTGYCQDTESFLPSLFKHSKPTLIHFIDLNLKTTGSDGLYTFPFQLHYTVIGTGTLNGDGDTGGVLFLLFNLK